MKVLVNEIQKAVNAKMGRENGQATLILRINGERVKVKVNAGDFYTPMQIAMTFSGVEDAHLEIDGPSRRGRR
jgi:hypothetical protein